MKDGSLRLITANKKARLLKLAEGYAYLFLDNGKPAEPGKPFSVQTLSSLNALTELLDIVKPYIKR
ncbi:hypothetical protein GDZ32_04485 [Lactobacillus helveticus]|uniref:Uncharacterized protein n=1 Tax=Lactobacillus helveticus TaxID=1587 RepID=A0A6A7K184_LACHE|nr:hypothetical protein [Lactobacillus helveticus]